MLSVKKLKLSSSLITAILLLFFFIVVQLAAACKSRTETPSETNNGSTSGPHGSHQLEIHILDVGQGDSILIITPERKFVLIDAGLARAGERVVAALERN